jgi:hypothetical protein
MASCEEVVDQMTELVEERHNVGVPHQPAPEVAHQSALWQLSVADSRDQVELRRVLVLALAGVQVEVDPAQRTPLEVDVVDSDIFVPRRGILHADIAHPEQPSGDVQQSLSDLRELEVPAHLLGIDLEVLAPNDLLVER